MTTPMREPVTYHPSKVAWATSRFIAQPPALSSRIFLYGAALLVAVAFAYASQAKVAIAVEARGVLVSREAVIPLKAPFGMKVARLAVRDNQRVSAGEVLVESEDRVTAEEHGLLSSQGQLLEELLGRDEVPGGCPDCLASLRTLGGIAFKIDNRGSIRQPLAEVRQLLLDYTAAREEDKSFGAASQGVRRRIQVAQEKLKEISARSAESLLGAEVERLTGEVVAGRAELASRRQELEARLKRARNALRVRLGELLQALELYRSQNTVRAPTAGIVSDLKISAPGQFLTAGQHLLDLIPSDSGLEAELFVANRDVSQVAPGMAVRLKLDALPEREYGAVDATVESVSANVAAAPGSAAPQEYRVRARLATQSVARAGVEHPLRLGMSLSGLVITRRESLLVVGARKVFNVTDELLDR
ncbi:MAG TPA: HlyD family efflux transporter periplasmic adaptor subunit [Myxococcales bacterium]|nr:HlyD family efflux transporter periplasmic adaptor subunit [Myxococcales bacterium]